MFRDILNLYNPLDEPILVKLLTVKPNSSADSTVARNFHLCKICDEDYEIDAIIFDSARLGHGHGSGSGSHTYPYIIKIFGYVTSKANYNKWGKGAPNPFVCITSYEKVTRRLSPSQSNLIQCLVVSKPEKVQGGNAGTFFQEIISCFTDDELSGKCVSGVFAYGSNYLLPKVLENTALFLTNHRAMQTLSQMNATENSQQTTRQQEDNNSNASNATSNYMKAIKEFSDSQLELQITSLTKNSEKHDAEGALTLVQQYSSALSMALAHARDPRRPQLTIEVLSEWHHELGATGLIPNAGRIRDKQVKAGLTTFTQKDRIRDELNKLILVLRELEMRACSTTAVGGGGVLHGTNASGGKTNVNIQQAYGPVVFASAVLF